MLTFCQNLAFLLDLDIRAGAPDLRGGLAVPPHGQDVLPRLQCLGDLDVILEYPPLLLLVFSRVDHGPLRTSRGPVPAHRLLPPVGGIKAAGFAFKGVEPLSVSGKVQVPIAEALFIDC